MRPLFSGPSAWRRGVFALLLVALGATFSMPGAAFAAKKVSKGDASVAKRSGKLYLKQRQYKKAIEQYKIAVAGKPDDAESHYWLGWLYSDRELIDEMNRHFDTCLSLKKGKKWKKKIGDTRDELWMRHYNIGVKATNVGKFDLARDEFLMARSVLPKNPNTHKGLGLVYLQLDSTEAGINAYLKSIELDSTDANAYLNVAIGYMNIGHNEEAVGHLLKAHDMIPKDLTVLKQLAMAQDRTGNKEGAIQAAEKALAVDPEDFDVLNMAAQIFLSVEAFDRSTELLEKVIAQEPDNSVTMFNLAVAYKRTDRPEKALELFLKSVAANPVDDEAWYQLGLLQDSQDNFDGAIEAFQKVAELKPANARAWRALSRSFARKSEVTQGEVAKECVKKAAEAFNMAESLAGSE